MTETAFSGAGEMARMIREGEVSSIELTDHLIDRIERFDLQRPQRVLRVLFSHALQLPRKKGGPTVKPRSPLS